MEIISYIYKFVFQDFRHDFPTQTKMKAFTGLLFLTAFSFLVR